MFSSVCVRVQVGELLQDVARIDSAAAKRQAAATSAAHAARNLTEAEADDLAEVSALCARSI